MMLLLSQLLQFLNLVDKVRQRQINKVGELWQIPDRLQYQQTVDRKIDL